jgi:hypothetical protein
MVLMAHLEYELLIVVFFFVCQNDKFNKEPTDTEIEFGKFHGIPALSMSTNNGNQEDQLEEVEKKLRIPVEVMRELKLVRR